MLAPPRNLLVALGLLPGVFVPLAAAFADDAPKASDVPKLAGTWNWTWKDKSGLTHRHILEVEGVGKKLAARERFDKLPPVAVTDLKLDGKNIRFAVVRGEHRADYSGVVADANTINGTVKVTDEGETSEFVWEARRETKKTTPPPQEPATPPEQ
jgi:hypothetical protein